MAAEPTGASDVPEALAAQRYAIHRFSRQISCFHPYSRRFYRRLKSFFTICSIWFFGGLWRPSFIISASPPLPTSVPSCGGRLPPRCLPMESGFHRGLMARLRISASYPPSDAGWDDAGGGTASGTDGRLAGTAGRRGATGGTGSAISTGIGSVLAASKAMNPSKALGLIKARRQSAGLNSSLCWLPK